MRRSNRYSILSLRAVRQEASGKAFRKHCVEFCRLRFGVLQRNLSRVTFVFRTSSKCAATPALRNNSKGVTMTRRKRIQLELAMRSGEGVLQSSFLLAWEREHETQTAWH